MIIVVIFSLIIKSLLFILLPSSGNLLLEIVIFISTIGIIYLWKRSSGTLFIFLTSPIFLWPGNWLPKLGVFLLILGGYLFSKVKILRIVLFLASLSIFIRPVLSPPLIHNPAILATINQLRGEDQKFGIYSTSRILHNKFEYLSAFTTSLMQDLNFTAHFGMGDQDDTSTSQWLPPLLLTTLPLLLLAIYCWRQFPLRLWFITLLGLLLGVLSNPKFIETNFYLFYTGITLIAGAGLDKLQTRNRQIIKTTSMILLIPMVFFSINYRPRSLLIATKFGLNQVINYSQTHPNQTILFSDNLYPHIGPVPSSVIVLSATDHRFLPPIPKNTILFVPAVPPQPKNSGFTPNLQPFISDYSGQPLLFTLTYVPK